MKMKFYTVPALDPQSAEEPSPPTPLPPSLMSGCPPSGEPTRERGAPTRPGASPSRAACLPPLPGGCEGRVGEGGRGGEGRSGSSRSESSPALAFLQGPEA